MRSGALATIYGVVGYLATCQSLPFITSES
jgi:hypothetical protein